MEVPIFQHETLSLWLHIQAAPCPWSKTKLWNLSVPLNWVHQTTAWKNNSSGCLSKKRIAPLQTSSRFLPAKTLYLHRQIAILNEWKRFYHFSLHCCCYLPLQHRLSQINTFTAKSNQSANSSRKVAPFVWTTARSGANNFQKKHKYVIKMVLC